MGSSEGETQEKVPEPEEESAGDSAPLLDLQSAVSQVPEDLRKEMEKYLRAEFREVIRWKPTR